MPRAADPLDPHACYLALKARDARFDGCFFTAVTSTGIYCRPVCRVRAPQPQNCRFFRLAAQAEQAGFRPCLRCRPELAPPLPGAWPWSSQDATAILAHEAMRLLDAPEGAALTVAALALRLGVSDRHLRRLFGQHLGVSPLQCLLTRRLLGAKQLLTDTPWPVAEVARASGFGSVRRFNDAFLARYGRAPQQLRRHALTPDGNAAAGALRLAYRPPMQIGALLDFLRLRALDTIELVANNDRYMRTSSTLCLKSGDRWHAGWVSACFDPARPLVWLTVSESLQALLPLVMARVRAWLDLDADPQAIAALPLPGLPPGLRVPGALDGFTLAVRAILGQQVTVAAGRTLAQRLLDRLGTPLDSAVAAPGLTRLFPSAAVLGQVPPEVLGQLGIVRQRQNAIIALARAVRDGHLSLHPGAALAPTLHTLRQLPGVGDWTAQYIAMRALHWPDAFPAGDAVLRQSLGSPQAAQAAAQAWRPWRSYAVLHLWAQAAVPPPPLPSSPS